jgi:hypothetical protein
MSRRLTLAARTPRRVVVLGVGLAVAVGLWIAVASPSRAATVKCPGTFQVLHNDRIGKLSLPGGPYNITASGVSCATASQLFTEFLNDWDGRLPGGWKTVVRGVGNGSFTNSRGRSINVQRAGRSGGGGGGVAGLVCSQRFVITQNDRIGALVIKKGRYIIDRLGTIAPTCSQDVSLLKQFLMDFDGVLPGGWVVLPDDGTFVRGSVTYGFRLEPDPQGGGGNRFPTKTSRCPATFRVLHNDFIGALTFPAGPYWVSIFKDSNITCPQSTQLFASFLQRPDGSLPKPWVIDVATGSFRRGKGSPYGFVAKPAFNVSARAGG